MASRACLAGRWPLVTITLISAVLLMLALLTRPAFAGGGVPLPAPAGTTWSIVGGYNTGTHSEYDGGDPHALDMVRTDAPTDWTDVLAPVDGTISYVNANCLSIEDSNGYAHLICHVEPSGHLYRNLAVSVGDHVGRVFPAGYDANGGIAHIHYAIHATSGDGYLHGTIPFTGVYALEGQELPWRDEYSLHSGLEFTSTNTPNHVSIDPPATIDPEPEPEPEPESTWTIPADAPVGGWRAVGVHRNTSVGDFFASLNCPLSELVLADDADGGGTRFDPTDLASVEVAVRPLQPGQAVWALVQPDAAWLPAPPPEPRQVTVQLAEGANLISWQGPDRDIADALGNVAHLSHAYQYDPYTNSWRFWSPNAPDHLNTLRTLQTGDALHIVVRLRSIWTQLQ